MKLSFASTPVTRPPLLRNRSVSGQALVIVLGFMTLMIVLVLAFFGSVQIDTASSRAAASSVTARQLAQSAVQLIEGTITQATVPAMGDPTATSIAWAVQPGMIRTYGTGTAGGYSASSSPLAYYKLYSSSQMVIPTATVVGNFNVDASVATAYGDLVTNWDKIPALYTDLNAPTTASDGSTVFPIADPRAGPSGLAVEGFSYSSTGKSGSGSVASLDNVSGSGGAGSTMPMPVQWIYVLKDGTLVNPTEPTANPASASNAATFPGGTNALGANMAPTAANPIVGRIAFWTDDECAKVNLNTASEGTYWDTPIADTGNSSDYFTGTAAGQNVPLGDATFAMIQPAQYEYQRYPGHPATTCLSSVFGQALNQASRDLLVEAIDPATPRISDTSASGSGHSTLGGTTASNVTLAQNFFRLYADVDEFNFVSSRSSNNRSLQSLGGNTQQIIEESRFFLTTSSKSPDLNPFGLPKITMWPIWDGNSANVSYRSPLDKEILQCSTVNSAAADDASGSTGSQHRMIFTRTDATSPTTDWNLPRNQQLIGYLQNMMGRAVPGVGGSFASKYGVTTSINSDSNQILTEIFDYIRCTNMIDQTMAPVGNTSTFYGSYTPSLPPNASQTANTFTSGAVGEVIPTAPPGASYQGFGRFPTIGEVAIGLIKIDDRMNQNQVEGAQPPAVPQPPANYATTVEDMTSGLTADPTKQTLVEWTLFPDFICPMVGYAAMGENIRVEFSNVNLTIGGKAVQPIGSPPTVPSGAGSYANLFDNGRIALNQFRDSIIGGLIGPDINRVGNNAPSQSMYPTGLVLLTGTSGTSTAPTGTTTTIAGSFTVQIFSPSTATSNPIQTFNFAFPSGGVTVPIPILNIPAGAMTWIGTDRAMTTGLSYGATSTFTYSVDPTQAGAHANSANFFATGGAIASSFHGLPNSDVVRSLSPANDGVVGDKALLTGGSSDINGDIRMIAASTSIPSTAFLLTPKMLTAASAPVAPAATDFMVSSMRLGPQVGIGGGNQSIGGRTVPASLVTSYDYTPGVPKGVVAATMTGDSPTTTPGDWDNGPGLMVDGPWLNKPDEGAPLQPSTIAYINDYTSTASGGAVNLASTYFSPNRQVSSPVMFGSLPVGLDHPWRTLLFRPTNLLGYEGGYNHPGGINTSSATVPPDNRLLDFFRMPVVEPYAISEPLATSGKINLNTQIAPFTYITRTTGMHAVLKSVMVTALANNDASTGNYKWGYANSGAENNPTRYPIDLTASNSGNTLNTISTASDAFYLFPEFNRKKYTWLYPNFFISPSQICDVPLVPVGIGGAIYTVSSLNSFWTLNDLTGDNSLERPYSLIYPRVTTQSNTFTVHVRAQSLHKVPTGVEPAATWTEGLDQVTGEYRGSFVIEKYFDPSHAVIADSTGNVQTDTNDGSLPADAAIRGDDNGQSGTLMHGALWRLLSTKRFGQ